MSRTLKIGLIGQHISRSRFSRAQSILCQAHDIALDFTPFDTASMPDLDFAAHIRHLAKSGFHGITVTHPHKPDAHRLASFSHYPDAIGAANTLIFRLGETEAHNTDYLGLIAAWKAKFGDAKPGIVAMAGAGGVARAIVAALRQLGAERVLMWDTDVGRAAQVARDTGAQAILPRDARNAVRAATGLVNATPMGMREYPGSAFDGMTLGSPDWAFDAVYTPIRTAFVERAESEGIDVLTGFDLFRFMAVESFRAYTGVSLDTARIAAELTPLAEGL